MRRGDSDYDNLRQIFVFQEYNIWGLVQASIISRQILDLVLAHLPKAVPFIVKLDIEGEDLFSANLSWLDEIRSICFGQTWHWRCARLPNCLDRRYCMNFGGKAASAWRGVPPMDALHAQCSTQRQ